MTAKELAAKCREVAQNHKTLYVMGCFGAPMTATNKKRYIAHHQYNRDTARTAKINAASADTFGFDCVCLIKGLLWGWKGDASKTYGGAGYAVNGVPDIDANAIITKCTDVSTNFSNIQVGELLWMQGHVGIYIGGGLAVESTPIWRDGVQITSVRNMGIQPDYNARTWTKHGKLPYVSYEAETPVAPTTQQPASVHYSVRLLRLARGNKGKAVKALQLLLIGYGYSCGAAGADGDFGSATDSAVRKFQKANGLTADGVVGPATWAKLLGA